MIVGKEESGKKNRRNILEITSFKEEIFVRKTCVIFLRENIFEVNYYRKSYEEK